MLQLKLLGAGPLAEGSKPAVQFEPHARASTALWMTYSMVKKALDESIPW